MALSWPFLDPPYRTLADVSIHLSPMGLTMFAISTSLEEACQGRMPLPLCFTLLQTPGCGGFSRECEQAPVKTRCDGQSYETHPECALFQSACRMRGFCAAARSFQPGWSRPPKPWLHRITAKVRHCKFTGITTYMKSVPLLIRPGLFEALSSMMTSGSFMTLSASVMNAGLKPISRSTPS